MSSTSVTAAGQSDSRNTSEANPAANASAANSASAFADPIDMQNRLFARLSRMFGSEVPLYDKSLEINCACNNTVCALLGRLFVGFTITAEQLERASGERHGAIRIGTADEYQWVTRFFACFGMEPHNFYDMTSVGTKSQPVIATAFRSRNNPDHRVFTSLLQTDYFDSSIRGRLDALLAQRNIFSDRAKALIEQAERDGGLTWSDAEQLIAEAAERIFKWTGRARDHKLYQRLCDVGFKIAADIACFERHHLNHLTPNTLCMDLYTSAMKFCLGEIDEPTFDRRAVRALSQLARQADIDWMRLHFKHLPSDHFDRFPRATADIADIASFVRSLIDKLLTPPFQLQSLDHAGSKDTTEGPDANTPVLLRQDAYKALTENVIFVEQDGTEVQGKHTARFGEIEQRFYAVTPVGRELYDRCLAQAEADRDQDPDLAHRDFEAFEAAYSRAFDPIPKTLTQLIERDLVYARYWPTPKGIAAAGSGSNPVNTADINELVRMGYADREGLRYEDFLPVSAAGIFASNLNQYGTQSTAAVKPEYTQEQLENVMGRSIIDADEAYAAMQARSIIETCEALGVTRYLPEQRRKELLALSMSVPASDTHSSLGTKHKPTNSTGCCGNSKNCCG